MMNNFNYFDQAGEALKEALAGVIEKTADDGVVNVKDQIIRNGQVDTGYMLSSVYKSTFTTSTYSTVDLKSFPECDQPEDDQEAFIAVSALYAPYQNYGTRYLPPRPFFEPGIEQTANDFEANCDQADIEASIEAKI